MRRETWLLIESLRGDLATLPKADAISEVTMRQFDATGITRLRKRRTVRDAHGH